MEKKTQDYFSNDQFVKADDQPYSFPICCMSWDKDTWNGLGAVFAGMLIQGALGIVAIWGNIVIYVTSKLRADDPNLSTQLALIVFPTQLAVGSLSMQLGTLLMDYVTPRT